MKTYLNKFYSIPDAAKRAGIEENQLRTLISVDIIKPINLFGILSLSGRQIVKIKNQWEWFTREGDRNENKQKES